MPHVHLLRRASIGAAEAHPRTIHEMMRGIAEGLVDVTLHVWVQADHLANGHGRELPKILWRTSREARGSYCREGQCAVKFPFCSTGFTVMSPASFAFVLIALLLGGIIGWLVGARSAAAAKQVSEGLRLQLGDAVRERDTNRDAVNEARRARGLAAGAGKGV